MKKLSLCLMVLAIVAISVATSQAAVQLLSDYTFDDATGGQVVAGMSGGTLVASASIGTGGIGAGVLSSTANADIFLQSAPFPAAGTLAAVGTESLWFKLAKAAGAPDVMMMYSASNGTDNVNHGMYGFFSGANAGKLAWYSKAHDGTVKQEMEIAMTGNTSWVDSGAAWHNITTTYFMNGVTGSTAALYLDGALVTTTLTSNKTGIDATNPNLGAYIQAAVGADKAVGTNPPVGYAGVGSRDDFATWGTQLDATQVGALWNLGNTGVASTKYNAKDASTLFDAFTGTTGASTSDGKSWTYVVSGLAGAAGSVGSNYVVLNGSGGGMQIASLTRLIVNGGTVTKPSNDPQVMPPGPGADVQAGILVLDYTSQGSPAATVKSLLTTSYNDVSSGHNFSGGQFMSSTATSARGLGWSDNTGTSKINVAYTLYGDANLDGTTNFTDLSKLLSKYNQTGVWTDGDFNYDGTVNFLDLSKMLSNYNQSVGTLTPSPEPSSIILLVTSVALMGGWLIRRRNRVA